MLQPDYKNISFEDKVQFIFGYIQYFRWHMGMLVPYAVCCKCDLFFLLGFHLWEVCTYPISRKRMQACTNVPLSITMVAQELRDM
jgi:hypothetical protein